MLSFQARRKQLTAYSQQPTAVSRGQIRNQKPEIPVCIPSVFIGVYLRFQVPSPWRPWRFVLSFLSLWFFIVLVIVLTSASIRVHPWFVIPVLTLTFLCGSIPLASLAVHSSVRGPNSLISLHLCGSAPSLGVHLRLSAVPVEPAGTRSYPGQMLPRNGLMRSALAMVPGSLCPG